MSEAELPAPLVPAWVDLRSYDWFPFYHKRLRQSEFWKTASDLACRISVDLWSEAYEQVPAGSIPNNDHILSEWAGFGRRDLSGWLAVKDEVLSAWTLCSDGRWYHPTLSEVASQAGIERRKHLWARECDRIRKENIRRQKSGSAPLSMPPKPSDDPWIGDAFSESSEGGAVSNERHPEDSQHASAGRPAEKHQNPPRNEPASADRPEEQPENPPENALTGTGTRTEIFSPSDKSSGEGAHARPPARAAPFFDHGSAEIVALPASSRRSKRSETTWPADLDFGDNERSFAEERGYRGEAAIRLWESFESRSKAKALTYVDWRQAWRNFVIKQIEFDAKAGRQAYAVSGRPRGRPPDV